MELPTALLERLRHDFATYEMVPRQPPPVVVVSFSGAGWACAVVTASMDEYEDELWARSASSE